MFRIDPIRRQLGANDIGDRIVAGRPPEHRFTAEAGNRSGGVRRHAAAAFLESMRGDFSAVRRPCLDREHAVQGGVADTDDAFARCAHCFREEGRGTRDEGKRLSRPENPEWAS